MQEPRQRGKRWQIQVFIDGKLVGRTFDTKSQAKDWARDQEHARAHGVRPPSEITVGEYYAAILPGRSAVITSATRDKNESHWRIHLARDWADKPLAPVRRTDVTTWVAAQVEAGVGLPTIEGSVRLLSAIFEAAVGDNPPLVVANPVHGVKIPEHTAARKRWISPAEVDAVLAELTEPYRTMCDLSASTGMAWGEIAGLKPESVQGDHFELFSVFERSGEVRNSMKTRARKRPVRIPAHLKGQILAAKLRARGETIFTGPHGGKLSDRNVNERHLTPACKRAGVERFTFHAFRHAYISWQIAAGRPSFEVAKEVGHTTSAMIDRTYGHLAPHRTDQAAEAIARVRSMGL